MFKKATTPKFWAAVKAEYQTEDGGRGAVAFDVQFKRCTIPEVRALTVENEGADDADLRFLRAVVTDWRKVPDDDGGEVPFTPEALQKLYEIGFAGAVVQTFFRNLVRAKEKN